MGRKNWLFSKSLDGAMSNGIILSLIETAKRNDLDPHRYIQYLLEHLPNEREIFKKEVLEAYLPWANQVQENCKPKRSDQVA